MPEVYRKSPDYRGYVIWGMSCFSLWATCFANAPGQLALIFCAVTTVPFTLHLIHEAQGWGAPKGIEIIRAMCIFLAVAEAGCFFALMFFRDELLQIPSVGGNSGLGSMARTSGLLFVIIGIVICPIVENRFRRI